MNKPIPKSHYGPNLFAMRNFWRQNQQHKLILNSCSPLILLLIRLDSFIFRSKSFLFCFVSFSFCPFIYSILFLHTLIKPFWKIFLGKNEKITKSMFGNCFFPLFSVFKNNFLFLRLKNLFDNSKRAENKNCFQNSICEGN